MKMKRLSILVMLFLVIPMVYYSGLGSTSVVATGEHENHVEFWILGIEFKGTADANETYIAEGDKVERYV